MPRGIPGSGPHARKPLSPKGTRQRTGNGRRRHQADATVQVLRATELYIADMEKKLHAARRLLVALQRTYRQST